LERYQETQYMSGKLSFKEYLQSKETLRKAVKEVPKTQIEYEVKKYCTFPIGESSDKQKIKLKPSNRLFISWLCEDKNNPKAVKVEFEGTDADETTEKPTWNDAKLLKWLLNNTEQS